tara:strand:+ start:2907 stop:4265 length:1359 start_codon:yes stop_codon:yes gene_type:complete
MEKLLKKISAFSLIEVMIVLGISTGIGLYMAKVISDMNSQVRYLETKGDELEMKYMIQMNFMSKQACSRTIGGYCENPSNGSEGWQNQAQCPSGWQNSQVVIKSNEAQSQDGLNIWTFNQSNAVDLNGLTSVQGSPSYVGTLFTSNGGNLLKLCKPLRIWTQNANQINQLISQLTPEQQTAIRSIIDNCGQAKFGKNLALSTAWILNYPVNQGGVDTNSASQDKRGRVALVIEYFWLNNKELRQRRLKIDLAVMTNSSNRVSTCMTQEDIEALATDQTYTVINKCKNRVNGDGAQGVWDGGKTNLQVRTGISGTGSCTVECGPGDQLIGGDPYGPRNTPDVNWNCDMNMGNVHNCDICLTDFNSCPDACKEAKYESYGCRFSFTKNPDSRLSEYECANPFNPSEDPVDCASLSSTNLIFYTKVFTGFSRNNNEIPFTGVRALCVKRFSNESE